MTIVGAKEGRGKLYYFLYKIDYIDYTTTLFTTNTFQGIHVSRHTLLATTMESSSKVEYYYDIALTPEVYQFVHGLGYKWANNLERFRYLMHSIQASGRRWETVKKRLQLPMGFV